MGGILPEKYNFVNGLYWPAAITKSITIFQNKNGARSVLMQGLNFTAQLCSEQENLKRTNNPTSEKPAEQLSGQILEKSSPAQTKTYSLNL